MPPLNQPIDAEVRIANLERQIAELRQGTITSLGGSVVLPAGTSLIVTGPEGQVLGTIGALGTLRADGKPEQGFVFRRDDGRVGISVQGAGATDTSGRQFVAMWDSTPAGSRPVVSTDAASGIGIATPYVPIGLAPRFDGMPKTSRTDGGWEELYIGTFYKQHPKATVRVNNTSDASDTAGEVRVTLDGTAVDVPAAVTFSIVERQFGPFPVPGDWLSSHVLRIEARRTSGTGAVRASGYALGVQS